MALEKESEQELMDVDLHNELSIGEYYQARTCVNYEMSRVAYTDGRVIDFDWEGLTLTLGQKWGINVEVNFPDVESVDEFAKFINRFATEARKFKTIFEDTKPSNWNQL